MVLFGDAVLAILVGHLFGVEHEGAQALLLSGEVQLVDVVEQRLHLFIRHKGQDGGIQGGPCVRAIVWLAIFGTPTLHLVPEGEPADFVLVQNFHHLIVEGLV